MTVLFYHGLPINLLPVDLDIIHPATGELDESEEDIDDGGYVSIKHESNGEPDVAPVTQLKLKAITEASGLNLKYRLNPHISPNKNVRLLKPL